MSELRYTFDSVAETYERSRPLYAESALDWIAERLPLRRVLDLAAGTGKLTRQLVGLGADVVAVEPGDHMRAVLERVVPGVQALAGTAEAIPLPDGSVDAIAVGQAFHWFEMEAALAEMHRVLRPGGGFALLWNELLWPELNAIVDPLRPEALADDDEFERLQQGTLFEHVEQRTFMHSDRIDADTVVERISSISAVIAAAPEVRDDALARVRALAGDRLVHYPMRTLVIVGDRVS